MSGSAIVIGAGLAGLAAAERLAVAGREVTVLEARDRVGGRTWSRRLANGATIEMGAEFILPGNTEVVALAERLGLGLWDKGVRYGDRAPRGGIGTDRETVAAAVAEVQAALAGLDRPATVRELLESLAIDPGAREAILARAEISSAHSADALPAAVLAGLAHIGPEPSPGVAGGNQALSLALAERLADAVRLNEAVTGVEWGDDGVRVSTAAGASHEADACVVAVPATCLAGEPRVPRPLDGGLAARSGIRFEPELPREQRDAFAAVRYGHAAKLFVPLAETVAPGAVMNVPERWWCWTATGARDRPMPVVSCFAGSPGALERLEVTAGPARWLESLARLRPDLALEPEGAVLSTWDDDPWVRAAYSIFPPAELTAALAGPVGALRFAGEHIGGPFNGLMEGAIRSGRAAAASLASRR